jgi:N5-(cytidine 5'-diphosphoramidyl)-L-glutamine hydrolase
MLEKIKIGITQRVDKIGSYDECRDALDQRLIDWVGKSGFVPVPIPNTLVGMGPPNNPQLMLKNWLNSVKIDAILLSGGNDIGDSLNRDLTENYLLSWAEKNTIPVLGICRGMQMIGTYSGVKLKKLGGHVKTRHHLKVDIGSRGKFPETVNSYHNQVLDCCPESFKVLARSEDGNLEAIVHKNLPWEGWMWHPEREVIFSVEDKNRLVKLFKKGEK